MKEAAMAGKTPPNPSTGKRARSAVTGEFVPLTKAATSPRTTVVETIKPKKK
jgi:hypothetical protein